MATHRRAVLFLASVLAPLASTFVLPQDVSVHRLVKTYGGNTISVNPTAGRLPANQGLIKEPGSSPFGVSKEASGKKGRRVSGKQLKKAKLPKQPELTSAELLDLLTNSRNKHEVRKTLTELQKAGAFSHPPALAIALATCRAFGDWRRAQALLYDFRRETDGSNIMPTSAALDAALGACGRAGKAEEALALLHEVAVPCKWPSPGVLGWIGLLEACARCKDVASAKQTLNDAAAALGLVGSSSDSSTTSTTDDGEEGVDESFKATLTAISKAEPLLLGAASAVFANGEGYGNPGPALLAATQAALEANGDEVAQSDAAQWRATVRALEGLQRRPGQLDLHGCGAQVSRCAVRAIARDNARARAATAAGSAAAYPALLPPSTLVEGLVLVTGRGLHSPGGNGVVKTAVVEELETRGVAQPLVCAEPAEGEDGGVAWAADFNPGVVSLTAEMLSALS